MDGVSKMNDPHLDDIIDDDDLDENTEFSEEELKLIRSIRRESKRGRPLVRRTASKRLADIAEMTSMISAGVSMRDIADELKLHSTTVSKDLANVHQIWADEIATNVEAYRGMFLTQLSRLQNLALESFKDSSEKTVTEIRYDSEGKVLGKTVKTYMSSGDPAFLTIAGKVIQQQAEMIGIDESKNPKNIFDKDAFIKEVAETVKEVSEKAKAIPVTAENIKEVEQPSGRLIKSEDS
jgi:hypothetical protein